VYDAQQQELDEPQTLHMVVKTGDTPSPYSRSPSSSYGALHSDSPPPPPPNFDPPNTPTPRDRTAVNSPANRAASDFSQAAHTTSSTPPAGRETPPAGSVNNTANSPPTSTPSPSSYTAAPPLNAHQSFAALMSNPIYAAAYHAALAALSAPSAQSPPFAPPPPFVPNLQTLLWMNSAARYQMPQVGFKLSCG
jgi:hypothetical protein